jgi:predicted unusual protein kinase regulating ubiquinone biosynthesis (AarF/ABC1/UbiB family)
MAAPACCPQVTLKSTVSTVVVTTLVLEGWSRELNPDLHIMDTLKVMLASDWKERLSAAVDKVRQGDDGGCTAQGCLLGCW